MAANVFNTTGTLFLGPQPFVFDRVKMLVGDPAATSQTRGIIGGSSEETFLPADLDGMIPPPAGDPNHFVAFPQGIPLIYKIWAYHVDFTTPANSTFSLEASVGAASFTSLCPTTRNCVPQTGTTSGLDAIADRLMFRNAYRRFADGHESMLNNYTVSANSVAGIRWFELRRTQPGNWSIFQQSTYQPDTTWRWMGGIASDNQGNVALGFSASSSSISPQIRYAGRLATDPLNTLSGEQHLFDGTGSQSATSNRWGDCSDLTVDPVDDCTFYYTNEHYLTTSSFNWRTRIGYFRFAECTAPQKAQRILSSPLAPEARRSLTLRYQSMADLTARLYPTAPTTRSYLRDHTAIRYLKPVSGIRAGISISLMVKPRASLLPGRQSQSDANRDGNGHRDGDCYGDAYCHGDRNSYGYGDCTSEPNSYSYCYCNSNTDCHSQRNHPHCGWLPSAEAKHCGSLLERGDFAHRRYLSQWRIAHQHVERRFLHRFHR
jgi:hypothetical protein